MKNSSINKVILGDYVIGETLGKGTFGKVKLGTYMPSKEKVAVKILEKSKMKDKDDYERVIREMQIIKKLNSDNVIKVYEILEDKENYFIIMEYCEEGELFNYIVKNKRLTEDEAAFFFYQLINGLESIHSYNIVHRDLKPENLLLNKEKKLKIIDFGLSNFYSLEGILLSTPCGSPCYASPEMVAGKKYKGFMIDVWSTGIILYAMICGYLPFEDPDNEKLFMKILECNLIFPSYVTTLVKDIIRKLLNTDPEKRITIHEIKKHNFYLLGKSVFIKIFGNNKTDRSTEGSTKDIGSGLSSGKSESKLKKTHIPKSSLNTIHQPSSSLNFNNFISSHTLSPQKKDNFKYDVVNTVGSIKGKQTKSDFSKYQDYNYQITDSNKITLTSTSKNSFNSFNKKLLNSDLSKFKLNKTKNVSSIVGHRDETINIIDLASSITKFGKIPQLKKNVNLEREKKRLINMSKDPVSFYSLDFNIPNSNKNSQNPKIYDFNLTKSKFNKENDTSKNYAKKILPSIKTDPETNKTKRSKFDSRNLYLKTETSHNESKNNSLGINKFSLNNNLNTTKYSNNLKFDKFSQNKVNTSLKKFKEKIGNVYTDIFSSIPGVKS